MGCGADIVSIEPLPGIAVRGRAVNNPMLKYLSNYATETASTHTDIKHKALPSPVRGDV